MMKVTASRITLGLVLILALVALALPTIAQDEMMGPAVEVSEQVVLNGRVLVDYAYSEGPGFIVIHIDNAGSIGPVIGSRLLSPGANYNVSVPVDASAATSVLYAMLHVDSGELGVYEFGTVADADGPVIVDGAPLAPSFNVAVINAWDQFVDGSFTAASVTVDAIGWLVIHSNNEGAPGPVLGATQIQPGINTDVTVALDGDASGSVWPMLHVDTGVEGEYEFGTVADTDGPVRLGGVVATTQIWTVPHMRVSDQIVTYGDGMEMMGTTVTAWSVLSEGLGWLVIHSDGGGSPGPVAGYAQVQPGINTNVVVELDPALTTPVLFPMLHVDTGAEGTYEFGTVADADGPVRVNDAVLTFPIDAAPSIVYNVHVNDAGDALVIESALIDAPGWMVIHSDNGGSPGPVLGYVALTPGWNENITVSIADMSAAGTTVFPMLHYDTGEAGVYEFGSVADADTPVRVAGNVVVGPAEIMSGS